MRAMPNIGVALYSDGSPFSTEGNVACEYRKVPFGFSAASDLPGQTLWITNATLDDLASAGLHRSPKFAHEGYFRTRISQMTQELGIGKLSLEQQAALLAELLGNAAEMARVQLGLTQYPSHGLAQAVGQLFGATEPPQGSAVYQVAEQACQRYTACERERRHERAEVFSYWMPRNAWSDALLGTPLPNNDGLKAIPAHALPSMGRDAASLVEWAEQSNIPLFARVRILAIEPRAGKLLNYGAGAQNISKSIDTGEQYDARNMREWCSLPELKMLTEIGDIQILQVAVASGWSRSGLRVYSSKISSVSYSYGLVAENLWTGITRKAGKNNNQACALSTAWLQAIDRMSCMKTALRLNSLGMEVINYGYGRITVVCPMSVRAYIPQAALEEGLMYPAHLEDLKPYAAQSANPGHVLQYLLNTKDYRRLIGIDRATLKELEALREA